MDYVLNGEGLVGYDCYPPFLVTCICLGDRHSYAFSDSFFRLGTPIEQHEDGHGPMRTTLNQTKVRILSSSRIVELRTTVRRLSKPLLLIHPNGSFVLFQFANITSKPQLCPSH